MAWGTIRKLPYVISIVVKYFCRHRKTICHPNSSYIATKPYGKFVCGCNNNAVIQKQLFSRFPPSTHAGHAGQAMAGQWPGSVDPRQSGKAATLLS